MDEQALSIPIGEKSGMTLEEAIEDYGTHLLRLCFLILEDKGLAEDALQDTFLKAYCKLSSFRGEASLKTWLTSIAINVCKDYKRKAWFRFQSTTDAYEHTPYSENFTAVFQRDTVLSAIQKLPLKLREVILLYYYSELKIQEISTVLSIPAGTVSVRLKRGREQLKGHLKEWYYD